MIEIFDDVLSPRYFEKIVNYVTSNNIYWVCDHTGGLEDEHLSFANLSDRDGSPQHAEFSMGIFFHLMDAVNKEYTQLNRIRYGLITRGVSQITNLAHIDDKNNLKQKVALFYLNDTDGETYIYKNKHPNYDNLVVDKKIMPKPNRLVIFDGDVIHASSTPTKTQLRYAINFNYE